jgi:hypothetical protein
MEVQLLLNLFLIFKKHINASTSGGRIKSDFEIDTIVNKMSVRGSINDGGSKLTLKRSGTSVNIIES